MHAVPEVDGSRTWWVVFGEGGRIAGHFPIFEEEPALLVHHEDLLRPASPRARSCGVVVQGSSLESTANPTTCTAGRRECAIGRVEEDLRGPAGWNGRSLASHSSRSLLWSAYNSKSMEEVETRRGTLSRNP